MSHHLKQTRVNIYQKLNQILNSQPINNQTDALRAYVLLTLINQVNRLSKNQQLQIKSLN